MRCRRFGKCLSGFKYTYQRSYIYRNSYTVSIRYQSTDINTSPVINEEQPNLLESDESLLNELGTFEMSVDELEKIASSNGADITIIDGIEYLQASDFFYAKFLPVKTTQFFMDWMSDYIPYWIVILSLPWLIKAFNVMPLIVHNQRQFQQRGHLIPKGMKEFTYLNNKKKEAHRLASKAEYMNISKEYNAEVKRLTKHYGFNPLTQHFKQMIPPLVQLPVHLTLFVATRTMYPSYPAWKEGGLLWFSDLSLCDPYYILPIISASTIAISGYFMTHKMQTTSQFKNIPHELILYATIAGSLVFIPVAGMFPAGLNLYLGSNIISFIAQMTLMENDKFRTLVGLKPTSFTTNIHYEISKVTAEMKEIANSGATHKPKEIEGKRAATGRAGRRPKVNVKTQRN